MMKDADDVARLLSIVDGARHWPRLKPIHDEAMAALEEIALDTKKRLDEKHKADEEKAAQEKSKQVADAKANEELDEEAARPKSIPAPGTGNPNKYETPPFTEEDNTVAIGTTTGDVAKRPL